MRDNLKFYDPLAGGVSVEDATEVWLRVNMQEVNIQFSYSLDGKEYKDIGGVLNGINLSDEAYDEIGHEGHTGTFIGMAFQDLSGRNLHADFDSFTYIRNGGN